MINTFEITINDIIKRDIFKQAIVIAGKKGLKNQVKWTHILETNKFESLINGGELILTTGAGLNLDTVDSVDLFKKLITKKTAGICIELGTHVKHISKDIINLADKFGYPIIVFDHFVKFVDITQDLHSLIINKHHHLLQLLNELSMSFNELSLLPNGVLKILKKLFTYTNGMALYVTNNTKSSYYPPETKNIEKKIQAHIMNLNKKNENRNFISIDNKNFVFVPVKGSGIIWGYLFLELVENTLENMAFPILEQAALAIAQIMLRHRTIEERKQYAEDKLVRNLLFGKEFNINELKDTFPILEKNFSFRLLLFQNKKQKLEIKELERDESQLQKAILLRSIFTQHGFSPAISIGKNEIAIIALFNSNKEKYDTFNFHRMIDIILSTNENDIFKGNKYLLGVSSKRSDLSIVNECYTEAKKVLFLKKSNVNSSMFYDDIGVYRLLLNQSKMNLESYVSDLLQPLIDHDFEKNGELLQTLEVFLECRSAKKEAAEKLFIVRQTLYHRLQKIEELLGNNYLNPNNRIAIETAIKANKILTFHTENY